MRGINPIYRYLSGSGGQIEKLVTQAKQLRKLDHTLLQILDAELAPHCRIGRIEGDEISILVDSPVWATQLRYKQGEILLKFNKLYNEARLSRIHIKVAPAVAGTAQAGHPHSNRQHSDIGSQCLESLAKTMPNTPLGTALRRLSSRLKKP